MLQPASEMRKKVTSRESDRIAALLRKIEQGISVATGNGMTQFQVSVETHTPPEIKFVIDELKRLGYDVKHSHGGDFRDTWDNLVINW